MIRASLLFLAACTTTIEFDLADGDDTAGPDGSDADTDTDADTDSDTDADTGPGANETWCHMIAEEDSEWILVQVEMSTGIWSELTRVDRTVDSRIQSSAWTGLATDGSVWVFPAEDEHSSAPYWHALDPSAGTVARIGAAGSSMRTTIGFTGSEWITMGENYFHFALYATEAGLPLYPPTRTLGAGTGVTVLSATGGEIFGARHSTDHVQILDANSGSIKRQILVEGYDGMVYGISGGGGKVHLYDRAHIWSFDATTGHNLEKISVAGLSARSGLWCTDTP